MNKKSFTVILFLLFWAIPSFADSFFSMPKEINLIDNVELSELLSRENRGESSVSLFYSIGMKYINQRDYNSAVEYFDKAIALDPNNAVLYGEKGKAQVKAGQHNKASESFQKSLEIEYEYIPIWEELVRIDPQFYFNLGMLYRDKAKEHNSIDLAEKGIRNLEKYISENPRGTMIRESSGAKNELELFITDLKSKERKAQYEQQIKEEESRKRSELLGSLREFRDVKPYIIKVNFLNFQPSTHLILTSNNPDIVEDSVSIKPNLSEFLITGQVIKGDFLLGGFIGFGNSTVDRQFVKANNPIYPVDDPRYEVKGSIASIKSFRIGGEALFNFYFRPPLLLYTGVWTDFATFSPEEKEDSFDGVSGVQLAWELNAIFSFDDFLGEVGYNIGILGNRKGNGIKVGLGYKIGL